VVALVFTAPVSAVPLVGPLLGPIVGPLLLAAGLTAGALADMGSGDLSARLDAFVNLARTALAEA
jgi:hypothetical protein